MNRFRQPLACRIATMPNAVSKNRPAARAFRFSSRLLRCGAHASFTAETPVTTMAATEVMNAAPRNSAMRNSRSLERDDSMTTSTRRKQKTLKSTAGMASSTAPKVCSARQSPRRHQHVEKDAEQYEEFHLAAPFHQGEAAAGVFERLGFVDHRQLEMTGGVVDRDASALGENQHEERQHEQHV